MQIINMWREGRQHYGVVKYMDSRFELQSEPGPNTCWFGDLSCFSFFICEMNTIVELQFQWVQTPSYGIRRQHVGSYLTDLRGETIWQVRQWSWLLMVQLRSECKPSWFLVSCSFCWVNFLLWCWLLFLAIWIIPYFSLESFNFLNFPFYCV